MKKIKFMLLALLAVVGIGGALAAIGTADGQNIIEYGNYVYKVTKMPTTNTPGEVTMMAIVEGKENAIVDADGNLDFPGHFTYTEGSKEHNFNVTKMDSKVYEDANYSVKHAVIPKELTEIPTGAFNTLTNLYDLTFEAGSQVTKIGAQAFASTQITTFDFSPCVKLEGLMDGVFVQKKAAGQTTENVNANITTITLPTSTAFKHINGAFRNLKALTTINNLENSWIRELVDEAFSGCEALKTLNLPGNDLLYISKNALKGSAIEELKVNVGTGVTNGNPMKLLGGCTVAYRFDEINRQYIYNYEDADGTKITAYNTAVATYNTEHPTATLEAVPTWEANHDAWSVADATTNLYGLSEPTTAAPTVAPLKKLTIEGTLKGKICTNAFAWCKNIDDETITGTPTPDFDVSEMEFGSKGQIQSHAFFDCTGIDELTLGDLGDNKLGENEGFTIDHNAFEGCPIATLTLGDILTANAIGSAAFGTSLKTVTIGSVKASAKAAFYGGSSTYVAEKKNTPADTRFLNANKKLGAFVWTDNDNEGATLKLAVGGSLSNDTPETGYVIPAKTFDMSNIDVASDPKLNPAIEIGEIASEGGVFAAGAIIGVAIEKVTFKGDIAANGLQNAILLNDPILTANLSYVQENDEFDLPSGVTPKEADAADLAAGDYVASTTTAGKYWKVKSIDTSVDPRKVVYESHDKLFTAEQIGGAATAVDPLEAQVEDYVAAGDKFKQVKEVLGEPTPDWNHNLKYLVFEGMIKTSGIGGTAFQNFTNLKKVTFGGLLSKEAVMAGAFKNTGKVNEGLTGADKKYNGCIGTKENPFVVYTADLTDNDASENPFATGAFNTERCTRIIYWSISDEKLSASILAAIQKDVLDNDGDAETVYDGEVVNPKFNVYKWVAYLDEDVVAKGLIVYPDNRAIDLDRNIDKKFAWGRYDLGSFTLEKGPNAQYAGNDYIQGTGYDAMDMIITRFQKDQTDQAGDYINLAARGVTTGNKYNVKVTLYGVYWDEDDFAQQSSVYMVPLEVINGQYKIQKTNTHTIIVKVENLDGEFAQADNQVLINYDAPEAPAAGNDATNVPDFLDGGNSVWAQLQAETAGDGPVKDAQGNKIKRIFQKANFSWTNQELVDAVKNASGTAQNIVNKDLYAMLNPAANAGFDIKRFVIERKTDGTGAYIGLNWYYTLLNSYPSQANGARIIWLDDAEATAIFGVKGVDVKESLRAKDNAIYNLQGVRVSKPGKGLYIQNGKKFIVK